MRNINTITIELQKARLALVESERRYNDLSHDAIEALREVSEARGQVSRLEAEFSLSIEGQAVAGREDEPGVRLVDKFNAERQAKPSPFRKGVER
jgi:hypothetical protein